MDCLVQHKESLANFVLEGHFFLPFARGGKGNSRQQDTSHPHPGPFLLLSHSFFFCFVLLLSHNEPFSLPAIFWLSDTPFNPA